MCHSATAALTNCVIADNQADSRGGGIFAFFGGPSLTNCTLTNNDSEYGGGIQVYNQSSTTTVYNCIVWGNPGGEIEGNDASVAFSDIGGGYPGQGNINARPDFGQYRGAEYVLRIGSPCIDAGSGEIRDGISWPSWYPNGGRSDMGAYGGTLASGWLP